MVCCLRSVGKATGKKRFNHEPNETQEARAMRLKGYGNAIVPAVAAEFIKAFQVI